MPQQALKWQQLGPVTLRLTLVIFAASIGVGLFRSLRTYHSLPQVGVEYTTELKALVRQHGNQLTLPHVKSAALIDFDNDMAAISLLESAREAGDLPSVVRALQALVRIRPEDGATRNELVSALLSQGRAVEAYEHGRVAATLSPNSATVYSNLGAALLGLGRKREAAAAYRKTLELDPGSEAARLALEFPLKGF